MRAIILAAGRGSRMGNLTDDRPKCLLSIGGQTLLERQISALSEAGIKEVSIVTGYKRELVLKPEIKEFHNFKWSTTNMVSSLYCADEWLSTGPCIVTYSDIFYESSAVKLLCESKEDLALTYDPCWVELWEKRFGDPLVDAETFRFNYKQILTEIGNQPEKIDEVHGQYMGLLRFTPEGWRELLRVREGLDTDEKDRIHLTGILQKIILAGNTPIAVIPYYGEWGEVDTKTDLTLYSET
ncbi:MAG: phosphocholine cytidylyltransferase family protein [Pseudomonadota bacterium]|nr:phosphocholine cytidylyltransferase family protein [Pseudomonadota bacterium]